MYVAFLAGGIASGKSTVARELERLGAMRIDLDEVSRDVLAPGSDTTVAVADAFGQDLIDATTGTLDRRLLAERAFATPDATSLLESIELPAIRDRLASMLGNVARNAGLSRTVSHAAPDDGRVPQVGDEEGHVIHAPSGGEDRTCRLRPGRTGTGRYVRSHASATTCVVVEVPLLDKVGDMADLADETIAVCCPARLRLARAVARGMDADDVARRMANQPTDAWLRAHADTVIENDGTEEALLAHVRLWWDARHASGLGTGDAAVADDA